MRQKGFSLVELMLVVLVISIITAACMPGYLRYVQKSRLTQTVLPVLRIMEQNVAVFYLLKQVMPGAAELSLIAGEEASRNLQLSLNGGEIGIAIDAPGLTDKIHLFDGQEIRATPEFSDGKLTGFRLSGEVAVALGFR